MLTHGPVLRPIAVGLSGGPPGAMSDRLTSLDEARSSSRLAGEAIDAARRSADLVAGLICSGRLRFLHAGGSSMLRFDAKVSDQDPGWGAYRLQKTTSHTMAPLASALPLPVAHSILASLRAAGSRRPWSMEVRIFVDPCAASNHEKLTLAGLLARVEAESPA